MKFITRYWSRFLFPLMTALAVGWFFIRVLPKPIRATYPCQQAAFPVASSLVIWLFGLKAGLTAWFGQKKGWWQIRRRFVFAGAGILTALFLLLWISAAIAAHRLPAGPPLVTAASISSGNPAPTANFHDHH